MLLGGGNKDAGYASFYRISLFPTFFLGGEDRVRSGGCRFGFMILVSRFKLLTAINLSGALVELIAGCFISAGQWAPCGITLPVI